MDKLINYLQSFSDLLGKLSQNIEEEPFILKSEVEKLGPILVLEPLKTQPEEKEKLTEEEKKLLEKVQENINTILER